MKPRELLLLVTIATLCACANGRGDHNPPNSAPAATAASPRPHVPDRWPFPLDVSALMQAPRLHHQHLPDALRLETGGFDGVAIAALRQLGHDVRDFGAGGWQHRSDD